jgi:hypothetical protein
MKKVQILLLLNKICLRKIMITPKVTSEDPSIEVHQRIGRSGKS